MTTPDVRIQLDAFDGAVEVVGSFDKSLQRQTKLINAALEAWNERSESTLSVVWFQLFFNDGVKQSYNQFIGVYFESEGCLKIALSSSNYLSEETRI